MKDFQKKNVNSKFTVVRLSVSGEKFEIFVDPDHALKYKKGESQEYEKAVAFDVILCVINI